MTHPWRIRKLAETASTNDDIKKAAAAGEAEGLVIQALQQTAGRGREDRRWESPEGNLYVSVLLRPQCLAQQIAPYNFIPALATHDILQTLLPKAKVTLKWPNDVLVQGKKISGILSEMRPGKNNAGEALIIGIGLNVKHHPMNTLYPATSLEAQGITPPALSVLLERLLERFWYWKTMLERDGFTPLREAWLAVANQGLMSVKLSHGIVQGIFAGLDKDGFLILQLADGTQKTITAGDVMAIG